MRKKLSREREDARAIAETQMFQLMEFEHLIRMFSSEELSYELVGERLRLHRLAEYFNRQAARLGVGPLCEHRTFWHKRLPRCGVDQEIYKEYVKRNPTKEEVTR